MFDKKVNKIIDVLEKDHSNGLTITEIVRISKLSRHIVLKTLAQLEGANKVSIRKVGMAKIYLLKKEEKNEQPNI